MKTLRNIVLAVTSLMSLSAWAGDSTCAADYKAHGNFLDAATSTSYFSDVVVELTETKDGGAVIAFAKMTRRLEIHPTQKSFLKAAHASFTNGAPVHVAFVEPGDEMIPGDPGPSALPMVRWLDLSHQHASCQ